MVMVTSSSASSGGRRSRCAGEGDGESTRVPAPWLPRPTATTTTTGTDGQIDGQTERKNKLPSRKACPPSSSISALHRRTYSLQILRLVLTALQVLELELTLAGTSGSSGSSRRVLWFSVECMRCRLTRPRLASSSRICGTDTRLEHYLLTFAIRWALRISAIQKNHPDPYHPRGFLPLTDIPHCRNWLGSWPCQISQIRKSQICKFAIRCFSEKIFNQSLQHLPES
jgi:hypothetical protein